MFERGVLRRSEPRAIRRRRPGNTRKARTQTFDCAVVPYGHESETRAHVLRVAQFDCRVFQAGPLRKSALAFFAHPETGVMVDNEIVLRNASESIGFGTSVIAGKLSLLTHLNVAQSDPPHGEVFDVVIDR